MDNHLPKYKASKGYESRKSQLIDSYHSHHFQRNEQQIQILQIFNQQGKKQQKNKEIDFFKQSTLPKVMLFRNKISDDGFFQKYPLLIKQLIDAKLTLKQTFKEYQKQSNLKYPEAILDQISKQPKSPFKRNELSEAAQRQFQDFPINQRSKSLQNVDYQTNSSMPNSIVNQSKENQNQILQIVQSQVLDSYRNHSNSNSTSLEKETPKKISSSEKFLYFKESKQRISSKFNLLTFSENKQNNSFQQTMYMKRQSRSENTSQEQKKLKLSSKFNLLSLAASMHEISQTNSQIKDGQKQNQNSVQQTELNQDLLQLLKNSNLTNEHTNLKVNLIKHLNTRKSTQSNEFESPLIFIGRRDSSRNCISNFQQNDSISLFSNQNSLSSKINKQLNNPLQDDFETKFNNYQLEMRISNNDTSTLTPEKQEEDIFKLKKTSSVEFHDLEQPQINEISKNFFDDQKLIINSQLVLEQNNSLKKNTHEIVHTSILKKSIDDKGNHQINNYTILSEIGRGGFGKVKLVYCLKKKIYFAMKAANKSKLQRKFLTRTTSAYTLLQQEIAILKKMDHENIVKLYEVIDDPENDKLYLVMELVEKGALGSRTYWKSENVILEEDSPAPCIPLEKLRKYLRDFLVGLHYLHNYAKIVHRDIKPDNLLIDENDTLKIADFGVATLMNDLDEIQGECGTKSFLTPEHFLGKQVKGQSADIWAAGVTFYYLAFGKTPFFSKTLEALKKMIITKDEEYPENIDPNFKDFLRCCLKKDQNERATLEILMNHKFVSMDGKSPLLIENFINSLSISETEIQQAITKLTIGATFKMAAKFQKKLQDTRERLNSQNNILQEKIK